MMYTVKLRTGFTGQRRRRAGVELLPGQTVDLELTAEQVAAMEADPEIVVEAVEEPDAEQTAKSAPSSPKSPSKAAKKA